MIEDANPMSSMVMLSALAARLIHLQSTRCTAQSPNIQEVDTYSDNAQLFAVAERLLGYLMDKVLEGNSSYIPVSMVISDLQEGQHTFLPENVRLVVRFLSIDCEFHFWNEFLLPASTRSYTKLIDYQTRSDRVRLTKYGRMFNRAANLQQDWMYEDKNVEKVLRAINSGEFVRIPGLAAEVITTLGLASAEITEIRENSTFQELAKGYFDKRVQFGDTIRLCLDAANRCIDRLDARDTRDKMTMYLEKDNANELISIKFIKEIIVEICGACEALSRNFTALIKIMQQDKSPRLGTMNFKELIQSFVKSEIDANNLTSIINDGFGWHPQNSLFSILGLEERLDIKEVKPASLTVRYSPYAQSLIEEWVSKHKEFLLNHLRSGPKLFTELLQLTNEYKLFENCGDAVELFLATMDPIKISNLLKVNFQLSQTFECVEIKGINFRASKILVSIIEDES